MSCLVVVYQQIRNFLEILCFVLVVVWTIQQRKHKGRCEMVISPIRQKGIVHPGKKKLISVIASLLQEKRKDLFQR